MLNLPIDLRRIQAGGGAGRIQSGAAPGQNGLCRPLDINEPFSGVFAGMQGGHVLMFRLKGQRVEPGKTVSIFVEVAPSLDGGHQQCPFSGVALHLPFTVFV
ncbi:hypothetical protein BMS3Abin13_01567 [bacterium BMS3Abin13]|nr:hypothetical protein BMS3Abin13_01567 [bacterium BMS3Abin13]